MLYHVNPKTGDAGECRSKKGKCPFGSADEHFTSKEAARAAFEKRMENEVQTEEERREYAMEFFAGLEALELSSDFATISTIDFAQVQKEVLAWERSATEKERAEFHLRKIELLQKLEDARIAEKKLHQERAAVLWDMDSNGSMESLLKDKSAGSGVLSPDKRRTIAALADLAPSAKEEFYSLSPHYLPVVNSSQAGKPHTPATVATIVRIARDVQIQNPEFKPANDYVPQGNWMKNRDETGMPYIQNASPELYSVLKKYVEDKYGPESRDFWLTVKAANVNGNSTRLGDFVRAERAFDKG